MVDISRETYEGNGIETIVDNDGLLWLNEKHIEEGLDYKNLWEIKTKYHSDQRKHFTKRTISDNKTKLVHLKEKICKHNKMF